MIGFVVPMHKSNLRPNGFEFIDTFIRTLYKFCKKEFILYLFDNASVEKYNVPNYPNIEYTYIENQFETGLVGAYNTGVNRAVKECDIIVTTNDDIIFNKTINTFFDIIENHRDKDIGLFGPLSNGVLETSYQYAEKPSRGIMEITSETHRPKAILRGFLIAFTKEFYEKFKRPDGNLFKIDKVWVGGEVALLNRVKSLGGKLFIIKNCWIFHYRTKGVRDMLRNLRKERNDKNESKNRAKNNIRRKRVARR